MAHWYDRAVSQLEKEYEEGNISNETYDAEMRDLNEELRQAADDAADSKFSTRSSTVGPQH